MSSAWKKIFNRSSKFKPENPETDGNANVINNQLETLNELIGSNKNTNSILGIEQEWIKNKTYSHFELMNLQADYWVNLVQFTFHDKYIDNLLYNLIRYSFFYNKVGLLILKENKYIPICEYDSEIDIFGHPKHIYGHNANEIFKKELAIVEPQNDLHHYHFTKKDIEEKKYIRMVNQSEINNYNKWSKFCRQQMELLDRYLMLGILFSRVLVCKTADPSKVPSELKILLNSKSPLVYNLSGTNLFNNIITSEGLDQISPENFCLYYEKFIEYYYEMLGRRINSDEKGARNLTSEIESTQSNYYILQNSWILNVKYLLEDFKNATGKSYEILNESTLDPEKSNELQKNQIEEKGNQENNET